MEDGDKNPISGQKVSFVIFHPATGGFRDFDPGVILKDGNFEVNIPFENFKDLGNYKIWGRLENGQFSDILDLTLQDKSIGIATNGVTFDYKQLIAGQEMTFKLEKLQDSMGNLAADGQCGASLYQTNAKQNVISKGGLIRGGVCSVTFGKGEVKTAGNSLITFGGNEVENRINQSRQINILPSNSINFGKFSGEYEPVRRDFTNNFIIGPATDAFGNLINAENLTLEILETKNNNTNVDFEAPNQSRTSSQNNSTNSDPRNIAKNKETNSGQNIRRVANLQIQDGFGKVEVPASFLDKENLTFRLVSATGQVFVTQNFALINSQEKIILPIIPSILKTDENLKLTVDNLKESKATKCELSLQNSMFEVANTETEISGENKCEFDWDVRVLRNQKFGLVEIKIGEQKFSKIIEIKAQTASNLFVVSPQIFINEKSEILLNLLTSPIMDKYGRSLDNEKLKWEYNSKKVENIVQNGLGKLELTMDKLASKDFKNNGGRNTLNLDIDVKAGTTSISKTNNLELTLGDFEITKQTQKVEIVRFANIIKANSNQIFQFKTSSCQALLNRGGQTQKLPTHAQNGNCFVQIKAEIGNYKLIFEENGFSSAEFDVKVVDKVPQIVICPAKSEEKTANTDIPTAQTSTINPEGCTILVKGTNDVIKVKILDDDKEYKFQSRDIENTVKIKQNGLNSNKKYLVIVEAQNEQKEKIIWQQMVPGGYFGQ